MLLCKLHALSLSSELSSGPISRAVSSAVSRADKQHVCIPGPWQPRGLDRVLCLSVQFVDLLALAGDAADNVPGVKGVGFKTAPLLIRKHGDVEGVLASAHEGEKPVCASCSAPVMHICSGCILCHPLLVCTSSGMSLSDAQLWAFCCTCLRVLLGTTPLGIAPCSCLRCCTQRTYYVWQVSVQCKMLSHSFYCVMTEHCT